ncbi:MAG: GNAT family N-acetyltransferase [Candidatus Heimdallarchaeota archaeon]
MTIEYREFQKDDLSMIKEFSENTTSFYEDWNIYAPIMIDNPKDLLFGAFQKDKILGLGNLRKKSEKLAWIEMVRVRNDIQKLGVGTGLFRFGAEEAKKLNYEIVAFATESKNIGSCKIGEKLGFKLLAEMFPYKVENRDEALTLIKEIPEGPKDYIAIGWEFVPLEKAFFDQEPDIKFYAKNKTILLEHLERDIVTKKVGWIKAIVYGDDKDAKYLISDFITRRRNLCEYLSCFTTKKLQQILKQMEFTPSTSEDGRQNSVVMWEKKY